MVLGHHKGLPGLHPEFEDLIVIGLGSRPHYVHSRIYRTDPVYI